MTREMSQAAGKSGVDTKFYEKGFRIKERRCRGPTTETKYKFIKEIV